MKHIIRTEYLTTSNRSTNEPKFHMDQCHMDQKMDLIIWTKKWTILYGPNNGPYDMVRKMDRIIWTE